MPRSSFDLRTALTLVRDHGLRSARAKLAATSAESMERILRMAASIVLPTNEFLGDRPYGPLASAEEKLDYCEACFDLGITELAEVRRRFEWSGLGWMPEGFFWRSFALRDNALRQRSVLLTADRFHDRIDPSSLGQIAIPPWRPQRGSLEQLAALRSGATSIRKARSRRPVDAIFWRPAEERADGRGSKIGGQAWGPSNKAEVASEFLMQIDFGDSRDVVGELERPVLQLFRGRDVDGHPCVDVVWRRAEELVDVVSGSTIPHQAGVLLRVDDFGGLEGAYHAAITRIGGVRTMSSPDARQNTQRLLADICSWRVPTNWPWPWFDEFEPIPSDRLLERSEWDCALATARRLNVIRSRWRREPGVEPDFV